MASNRELIDEATSLGAKLGVEVDVKGLKNDALEQLVADLRSRATAADGSTPDAAPEATPPAVEASAPEPAAQAESEAPPSAPVYRVSLGISLSTRRGIKDGGAVLDPEKDILGGVARLEELVLTGAVTKS